MGKGTTLAIEVRVKDGEPIFLALARTIIAEIERGRLKPGDALPGTRSLAKNLKLNRNTVDAAYHELTMQGWLNAVASRGTFVADDLPDLLKTHNTQSDDVNARSFKRKSRQYLWNISDGAPDARLLPIVPFGQAFRRALTSNSFLDNQSNDSANGNEYLRSNLSTYLNAERGLIASEPDILISRGSQMALFLAARAIAESGISIAVENPGYPLAWAAFRAAGANLISIPVDDAGIDVDVLEAIAKRDKTLRAVYITPHHQYPTTVTLGAARRLRLIDIARRYGLTIIEDDYDSEYRYDGRPVLPLRARADKDLPIIYLGSLSKLLAPGIRVGYAIAPQDILKKMALQREAIDRQGDVPLELALSSLIADGTMKRHARKARRIYHARRDFLAEILTERLGDDVEFTLPSGGLAIWLRLKHGLNAQEWSENATRLGLALLPGIHYSLDETQPIEAFRLGFASMNEEELSRAIQILVRAKPA
ncbi:PLP-dependent aminotransferase family protein [Paenochrobactrum sp. BZR 588]|uniref:MocR-like pyridoxine biosynthesis transcription factor PdxR n=1 Tax=Paenochrobactrum TaxID=999488 RepID=UPI0035BC77C6